MIARNEEQRQAENLEEDIVTTIMAETKKTLARARRSKELEVRIMYNVINVQIKCLQRIKQVKV